jgi:hypothetical protein
VTITPRVCVLFRADPPSGLRQRPFDLLALGWFRRRGNRLTDRRRRARQCDGLFVARLAGGAPGERLQLPRSPALVPELTKGLQRVLERAVGVRMVPGLQVTLARSVNTLARPHRSSISRYLARLS